MNEMEMTREDLIRAFNEMANSAHAAQRMVNQLINGVMFLGVLNVALVVALCLVAQR